MKKAMAQPRTTLNRHPANHLRAAIAAMLALLLNACALPTDPGWPLPEVADPAAAATVFVASAHNPSDKQFAYLLKVDGETVMELRESDKSEFKLDPGTYDFKITCHVVPDPEEFGLTPPKFAVVDGSSEVQATLASKDELCLTVGKTLVNCARLEDAAMSRCR